MLGSGAVSACRIYRNACFHLRPWWPGMTEMLLYFDMKVATPNGFIPESRGLLKHARLKAGCFVGTSVFCCPG